MAAGIPDSVEMRPQKRRNFRYGLNSEALDYGPRNLEVVTGNCVSTSSSEPWLYRHSVALHIQQCQKDYGWWLGTDGVQRAQPVWEIPY
jgi:hypothetical protein